MGDNKKWTRRAAVGSLASGGGLLLFGTGGSTQITSDRDVEVNAGEGENAVLDFIDNSSETTVESGGSQSSVYKIADTDEIFAKDSTGEVDVTAFVDGSEIPANVDTDSSPFDVTVGCDSANPLNGEYPIKLMFEASAPGFAITATRLTSQVLFDCGLNYGDSANYRDNSTGTDIPPRAEAKGEVDNPAGVNVRGDESTATLISEDNKSDVRGANIGFALPPVSESSTYELEVVVSGNQVTGDWAVALVKNDGSPLTRLGNGNKDKLQNSGSNVFQYELDREINPNETIDLYLIFNTTSNGNQKSVKVDYFELTPVQSQDT